MSPAGLLISCVSSPLANVPDLAELERWLLRASREVDALAVRAAPRCVGPRRGSQQEAAARARTEHSEPIAGLSFEREIRIAASLHDLSAALANAARMARPAASALDVGTRPDSGRPNPPPLRSSRR